MLSVMLFYLSGSAVQCRSVPCAMEISAAGVQSPSGGAPLTQASVNGDLGKVSSSADCPMEDRGVDLSFDTQTVKKEHESDTHDNFRIASVKIKQECDVIKQESANLLTSPGGRLKIFQSKFFEIFSKVSFLEYFL